MGITSEQIHKWREVAAAASQDGWQFGATRETEPDDVVRVMRETYERGPAGPVWCVHFPEPTVSRPPDAVGSLYVAITGNGPTSEANAKYIAWCAPSNVLALLDELAETSMLAAFYRSCALSGEDPGSSAEALAKVRGALAERSR